MRPIVRRLRSSRPLRLPDGAGATLRADGLLVALAGSNAAVGLAFAQHARRPVGPPPDDHEEVPMSSNGHEQTLEHDAAVPETGVPADHDAPEMIHAETPAHGRLAGKFDTADDLRQLEQDLVHK